MDIIDLSGLFNTKSQAEDFSARLTIISGKVFETGFNPEKAFLEQFGIVKQQAFMLLLRDNKVNAESRLAIKEFIDKIQAKIVAMTVISMVFAFEPKNETLQALSQWFILNVKKQVLFDITVDESIIGGAAILSGGKYLDYSIKPTYEKIMNTTLFGQHPPQKTVVKVTK